MTRATRALARWKKAALFFTAALAAPFALFFTLDFLFPFPRERLSDALGGGSILLQDAEGGMIAWGVDPEENWRLPVKIGDVSPWLVEATIAVEDKRFRSHLGVDPVAVARAATQNIAGMRRVSGASTLSMQTIRLLWQRPRTFRSKLVEMFRAVQLERLIGKDGILELYFNLAPYGGNVVGAEAAARRYFGKSAASLTLGEASLLAGIPQSPSRLSPARRPGAALRRRRQVLRGMRLAGIIDGDQADRAAEEPLDLEAKSVSRASLLHLADWARSARKNRGGIVRTTVNAEWQSTVERMAAKRLASPTAAANAAGPSVVVLSVRDSSVLAYLGNAAGNGGVGRHLDGARAKRQPGSLLKPFIFCSLADRGEITPATKVLDAPENWRDYLPRNIDHAWLGEMDAGDALRRSRNTPAVRQLSRLGLEEFARILEALGLDPGRPKQQGLTMALGAQEQRLIDLANAYAALGRLGAWRPLLLERGAPPPHEPRTVWSKEAAWLTLSALAPPESARAPALIWKTGTSWNHRDAWAVAMTPEAVVAVWTGIRSGSGTAVTGAEAALPLALDIIDALGLGRNERWLPPEGVAFVEVCAESGDAPGWSCLEPVLAPALKHRQKRTVCAGHVNRNQRPDAAGPRTAGWRAEEKGAGPKLRSPLPDSCFVLAGEASAETLVFSAEYAGGETLLHWFVDGRKEAVSRSGEGVSWRLVPGSHSVTVSDGDGKSDSATFTVVKQ